ncbi:MAG TPA: flagellar motor protein MotB [Gemmatimonadaceae bacterium]|nr:flagellar motor protein MotB [Gemmatimonadaceae bacterium]
MSRQGGGSPIIVKKVTKRGHGHHGGSWKVAYADFVTAMMAFFMVMWLVGLDDQTRKTIQEYFSRPVGLHTIGGGGDSPIGAGASPAQINDMKLRLAVHKYEESAYEAAASHLRERLDSLSGSLSSAKVEVTVGTDGLRIELIEGGAGDFFFPRGSAAPRDAAITVLSTVTQELLRLQNPVVVEGHTDASPYGSDATYTNWELSADRANAARRVLEQAGLPRERLSEVRGLADTRLRNEGDPFASENRRISLLLPFTQIPARPIPVTSSE